MGPRNSHTRKWHNNLLAINKNIVMEKNLSDDKARKKFKDLVEDIQVCMFITNNENEHDHTRPMATIEVEDDGTLWFFTDIRSIKVEEVSETRRVHLVYAHPGKESYLDVWGNANVIDDKQQIKDKWTPIVKAYFPNGPEDENIALLKVQPDDVRYWDAEHGKMVAFLKMAASVVTGKRFSEGESGDINV